MGSIVDLTALGLVEEEVPVVDWNAPESGQYPPRILPGDAEFIFKLAEEKPFDAAEFKTTPGKKWLVVNFTADIPITDIERLVNKEVMPEGGVVSLNFQRVNDYLSEKMKKAGMISSVADLCRSLALRPEPFTRQNVIQALTAANGTARGSAVIGWEFYCKGCGATTVSTKPRKASGDAQEVAKWPRGADKKPELMVACPYCGAKGFGREFIQAFHIARAANPAAPPPAAVTEAIPF